MADYISRDDAVCIADYAVDEHPYDKDRARPETYSDYNQGWNDACDYIRDRLEKAKPADVEPVRRGRWISLTDCSNAGVYCSICHKKVYKEDYAWCNRKNKVRSAYCPNCGSKMDLEKDTYEM